VYFQDVSLASARIGLAGPASLLTNPVESGTLQEEGESFQGKIAKNEWHQEPTPEGAWKESHIRNRSRQFVNHPG
jgi:hypothetical protein